MVFEEVTNYVDYLATWSRQRRKLGLGVAASREVQEAYGQIANYVYQNAKRHHADEFCSGGDGWVIAHALAMGSDGIVVTHETPRSAKGKIKVPIICDVFGVKWINLYQMLTELKFKF